ncbi:MAG: NADH-quinone oxidoreductase subunit A [Solirubrobacterales bacterium]
MHALSLLLVLGLGALALAGALAALSRARGVVATEVGRDPSWPRYHVRYYTFALLFIAFDMEMAYMYPWAVVLKSLGWFAFAEIGFFLTILGLGILYAWREGALEWQ